MRLFLLLPLLLVISADAVAGDSALYAEVGGVFANMGKITRSDDASTSLIGTPQLIFSLSGRIWDFKPELAYTVIGRKGPENTNTSRLMVIEIPYLIPIATDTYWKVGASLFMHSVSGGGGPITLSNGTGTATFYQPDGTRTARTLAFTTGIFLPLAGPVGFDFDVNLLSPLSTRRTLDVLAQLTWTLYE